MSHLRGLLYVLSLSALPAWSAVIPSSTLENRGNVDCQDPSSGLDSSCWKTLGLSDYVKDAAKNLTNCNDGFAQCYLNSIRHSTFGCNTINNNGCSAPHPNEFNSSKDFYVTYNIYAINQAFNTYYNGISAANTLASESVGAIVQLLNPPKQQNVIIQEVLSAITAGLLLLPEINPIVTALVSGIISTNSVSSLLFPTGTADSQNAQFGSLDQKLGDMVHTVMGNIDKAFPAAVGNVSSFLNFAESGQFSIQPNQSLFQDTSQLLTGLETYVISQALQANNIFLTRNPNTSTDTDSSDNSGDAAKPDEHGLVDAVFVDGNASYGLVSGSDWGHNYNKEMGTMFSKWTTGKLLLSNAVKCKDQGNSQKPLQLISDHPGGNNSVCLSNLKVCTWNEDLKSAPTKLFTDCDNIKGWQGNTCSDDGGIKVPPAYGGPIDNTCS